jgi:exo-beta-1,3-glucanase (GH17 family)
MHRFTDLQRRLALLAVLALAVLGANLYWWQMSRPVELADAPSARIACVSYAPYRKAGETPFDPGAVVSPERIEEDLAALARRFDCVRTYSVGAGLDQVPAIARRHGMKVLLGIWLSRTAPDNERELSRGIAVARENRDVVRAVVVGNEVLLRGELPQTTLATLVRRVRDETGLPVTYADVWEFWLKYPEVGKAVSFITIHILPYWEDEPVGVADALVHVREVRARMQAAFPDRDILIGETGWPSAGRERREAVPSRVNQARYVREFLTWAEASGVRYNLIEAFDQPWKRRLEGTVGGYWGLYDDALEEKFPLQGPVVEEPHWRAGILAGLALGGFFLVAGGLYLRGSVWGLLVLWLSGDALGATLYAELRHMGFANRDLWETALTASLSLWALGSATLITLVLARWVDRDSDRALPLPLALVAWRPNWRHSTDRLALALGVVRFGWLFAVAVMDLLLVFDARYRDFPTLVFIAPGVGLGLCALAPRDCRVPAVRALEERMCALWILAASLIIVVLERPSNTSADLWAILGIGLAWLALDQTHASSRVIVLAAGQYQGADADRQRARLVAVQDQGSAPNG